MIDFDLAKHQIDLIYREISRGEKKKENHICIFDKQDFLESVLSDLKTQGYNYEKITNKKISVTIDKRKQTRPGV